MLGGVKGNKVAPMKVTITPGCRLLRDSQTTKNAKRGFHSRPPLAVFAMQADNQAGGAITYLNKTFCFGDRLARLHRFSVINVYPGVHVKFRTDASGVV